MKFTIEQLKTIFSKKGYLFTEETPNALNIIGVRSSNIEANLFDDWLYLTQNLENGDVAIYEFPITTDPGAYWLKNPMNVDGTAILVPGQYLNSHRLGLHQGKYEALKQNKPVKVWRDNNGDTTIDQSGEIYEGVFGINIHRSNAKTASNIVEKWSAGCQVFKKVNDFNLFIEICKNSGQENFTYTLLEETDFQ